MSACGPANFKVWNAVAVAEMAGGWNDASLLDRTPGAHATPCAHPRPPCCSGGARPAPQFVCVEPNAEKRPAWFNKISDQKMLRPRSHFREKNSLVLRRERHITFEILQHHRASSEANPIRPRLVPIRNGCEIAACGLGHFQERRFQNRGALEIRLGF